MGTESFEDSIRFKTRLETLSDLVFGLALSIGSIALIQHIPQQPSDLINDVSLFGFSFLLIVAVWLGYTRILSVLSFESSGALILNLALLFFVVLEPFLYYVLETAPASFLDFWSIAFALDMGLMMGLLSAMMYLAIRQERHVKVRKLHLTSVRRFNISMVSQVAVSVLFLASVSNIFWISVPIVAYARFLMWYIALGIVLVSRVVGRPQKK